MNGHEQNPLDLTVIFKDALKGFCKVAVKYILVLHCLLENSPRGPDNSSVAVPLAGVIGVINLIHKLFVGSSAFFCSVFMQHKVQQGPDSQLVCSAPKPAVNKFYREAGTDPGQPWGTPGTAGPRALPAVPWGIPGFSPGYSRLFPQGIPGYSPGHSQLFPRGIPCSPRGIPGFSPGYSWLFPQGIPGCSPGHFRLFPRGIPSFFPRAFPVLPRAFPTFFPLLFPWGIPGFFPGVFPALPMLSWPR